MMKKRLLALALCLVMVSSLLPITAAAYTDEDILGWIDGITANGTYCGDTYFTISVPEDVVINWIFWNTDRSSVELSKDGSGRYKLDAGAGLVDVDFRYKGTDIHFTIALRGLTINQDHKWSAWTSNGDGTHSRSCKNGCVDSPQTASCADTSPADCKCDDCGASMHTWQFKAAGNTLTGSCGGANCDIGQIVLTLKADSVTLPNSPFNARLEGWENFKKAVPSATYNPNSFDYKLNGEPVTDKSNPKAGNYQAGILISNLPGTVEYEGVAERANTNSAYLFTQYTAVDPAVTAQTGDNRPIEIMVASVVVFSALAAAAFILDSKRRSQQ